MRLHRPGLNQVVLLVVLVLVSSTHRALAQAPTRVPRSAEVYDQLLSDARRDAWQNPNGVIATMSLRPTDVVAEIAAQSGSLARRLAPLVMRVYSVTPSPAALIQIQIEAPPNLTIVLAGRSDPRLAANSVDKIIVQNVLSRSDDRLSYLARLLPALKATGVIFVIDFYKRGAPLVLPDSLRIDTTRVTSDFRALGFKVVNTYDILPHQFFLELRR